LNSGILTEGSSVGDTVVEFTGHWTGTAYIGQTGKVIKKPGRVKWDAEVFRLDSPPGQDTMNYESDAGGHTYKAVLTH
jgi:hypothetical protein